MRYILKQKMFSIVDRFTVRDVMGRDVYWIDGEFSFCPTLHIRDVAGNELAQVRRHLAAIYYRYDIYRANTLLATVNERFLALFGSHYDIKICNGEEVVADGDFLSYDYTLTWRGICIASICKELSFTDSYAVNVTDGHDPVPILAIALIIDLTRSNRHSLGGSILFGM